MRWLTVAICCVILIWLGIGTFDQLAKNAGTRAKPVDPKVLDATTTTADVAPTKDEEPAAVLRNQFLSSPLSGQPFFQLLASSPSGSRGLESDRRLVAEHLLKVAPRSAFARVSLAELDLLSGNFAGATTHISRALSLGGPSSTALLDALAAMARNAETRPFVASLLADEPRWSSNLIMRLAPTSAQDEYLWAWANGDKRGEAAVVNALIRQNRVDLAYSAFLSFLEPQTTRSTTLPFDSNFKNLPGSGPFGWNLDNKAASFEPNGGLAVSSYGQTRRSIARQVSKLPPGLNRASIVWSGDISDGGNSFEWAIYCYTSTTPFWTMAAASLPSTPTLQTETLSIPEKECEYQRIELAGLPGDFPRTGRALIRNFEIKPLEQATAE